MAVRRTERRSRKVPAFDGTLRHLVVDKVVCLSRTMTAIGVWDADPLKEMVMQNTPDSLHGRIRVDLMIHADRSYCECAPGTRLNERVCVGAYWFDQHQTVAAILAQVNPMLAEIPATRYPHIVLVPF